MQPRFQNEIMSRGATANPAEDFIDRVKEALSLTRDEDLATRLNLGKSTIATWRRRGSIPFKKHAEIEELTGVKYTDVLVERLTRSNELYDICRISYLNAISKLFNEANKDELNELSFRLSRHEDAIARIIRDRVSEIAGEHLSPESVVALVHRAYNGDFISPMEIRDILKPSSEGSAIGSAI
ncbi:MAG: helix-turn-helix domain-containing protein [Methylocystis silviterrae]|uniref:helix-turn-helix domain-containing protein n=1 Tax=Methylocystis silviterrae TaxID=2743612 RepID=UPI003C742C13